MFRYKYILDRYKIKVSSKTKKSQEHSPTLNTVLMVEHTLKKQKTAITIAELKRKLPKKVMHNTLLQAIDYLQLSRKIIIGTKGVLWIFDEGKELNSLIKRGR